MHIFKYGTGVWDVTSVREQRDVTADATKRGVLVHFARIFDLCVEKGSEFPEDHPDRKSKGCAAFQGSQAWDSNHTTAVAQDLS